jgi:transposase InsO family protein
MPVRSISGGLYFLTFIDDCSRYIILYIISTKDQALENFKRFKAFAEKQLGRQVKALRTVGGGEFCSKEFDKFLRDNGIARQKTPPDTPQHNGVAERGNRTILDDACYSLRAFQTNSGRLLCWPQQTFEIDVRPERSRT